VAKADSEVDALKGQITRLEGRVAAAHARAERLRERATEVRLCGARGRGGGVQGRYCGRLCRLHAWSGLLWWKNVMNGQRPCCLCIMCLRTFGMGQPAEAAGGACRAAALAAAAVTAARPSAARAARAPQGGSGAPRLALGVGAGEGPTLDELGSKVAEVYGRWVESGSFCFDRLLVAC
jgi:hypothetical protein